VRGRPEARGDAGQDHLWGVGALGIFAAGPNGWRGDRRFLWEELKAVRHMVRAQCHDNTLQCGLSLVRLHMMGQIDQ
jgi:hypothetical protein